MKLFTIVQEGHEYDVSTRQRDNIIDITTLNHDGSTVLVAEVVFDDSVSQVFASYFSDGQEVPVDVPNELYWNQNRRELAEWLISGLYQ